jgi:hypothetical protein
LNSPFTKSFVGLADVYAPEVRPPWTPKQDSAGGCLGDPGAERLPKIPPEYDVLEVDDTVRAYSLRSLPQGNVLVCYVF